MPSRLRRTTPLRSTQWGIPRKVPPSKGAKTFRSIRRKPKPHADFEREYGSDERRAWVSGRPCIACGHQCPEGCENAHVGNDGRGRKAGYAQIVPLCRGDGRCARKQTAGGWSAIGLTKAKALQHAAATERAWRERGAHSDGEDFA